MEQWGGSSRWGPSPVGRRAREGAVEGGLCSGRLPSDLPCVSPQLCELSLISGAVSQEPRQRGGGQSQTPHPPPTVPSLVWDSATEKLWILFLTSLSTRLSAVKQERERGCLSDIKLWWCPSWGHERWEGPQQLDEDRTPPS